MADRAKALDKIRKLIALASSPHPEEARSAAHKAAALIREFKFEITDTQTRVNVSFSYGNPGSAGPFTANEARDRWRDFYERAARTTATASEEASWRLITAKYEGKCSWCRGKYTVGDRIFWKKGYEGTHFKCPWPKGSGE